MKLKLLLSTSLCVLLASCANINHSEVELDNYSYQLSPLPQSTSDYLTAASEDTGSQQTQQQLLAITSMLQQRNINAATQELKQLNKAQLTSSQLSYTHTLEAYLALINNQTKQALNLLNQANDTSQFSPQQLKVYFKVAYQVYLRNNLASDSVIAQINLYDHSSDQRNIQLNDIWRNLQKLPQQQLAKVLNSQAPSFVKGWFQLALIAEQESNNPANLVAGIKTWKEHYPQHAANQLLPPVKQLNAAASFTPPAQIALLLPLSGRFSSIGNAVRNGFMTAYYQLYPELAVKPSLRFYDTNKTPITTLYQQAVANGASFVIGPLSKPNLQALIDSDEISVPTLALNYTDSSPSTDKLVEFGLSPLQSARQAAELAWQQGASKVLTITPNSSWGSAGLQSFDSAFAAQGGSIVGSLRFKHHDLANQVADLLHIDRSVMRKANIQKLTGKRVQFTPRRRYDANAIFLLATPSQAREIHPLLKFYFAGSLPIYATPEIYQGYQQPDRNRDLNSIHFLDMPFLISNNPYIVKLRHQIQITWPQSYRRNNRFYAVGIDAFSLSVLYQRLNTLPNFGINGFTGRLYLNGDKIYRQLLPAVIHKGYVRQSKTS